MTTSSGRSVISGAVHQRRSSLRSGNGGSEKGRCRLTPAGDPGLIFGGFRQGGIESQQLSALSEHMFLGAVGEKAEVTDAHEAIGEHVEEKTADEFVGIEGHRFQPVSVPLRAKSG